jgi:hypothetical protein
VADSLVESVRLSDGRVDVDHRSAEARPFLLNVPHDWVIVVSGVLAMGLSFRAAGRRHPGHRKDRGDVL